MTAQHVHNIGHSNLHRKFTARMSAALFQFDLTFDVRESVQVHKDRGVGASWGKYTLSRSAKINEESNCVSIMQRVMLDR